MPGSDIVINAGKNPDVASSDSGSDDEDEGNCCSDSVAKTTDSMAAW